MDEDTLLIRQMKGGDPDAIDTFVRKYYPGLLRYCRLHIPDPVEAEDLTQEVFIRFFQALGRYRHYGKAKNYLYAIARNQFADYFSRRNTLSLDEIPEQSVMPMEALDVREDVRRAFSQLPSEIRETAILFFLQRQTQRDIARILEISLSLVKYRVARARELLQKALKLED